MNYVLGYSHAIMRGVHNYLSQNENSPLFQPVDHLSSLDGLIKDDRASGIIGFLVGSNWKARSIPAGFPAINLSNLEKVQTPSVLNDDQVAGYKAAQLILGTSPGEIVILSDPCGLHQKLREKGAISALEEAQLPYSIVRRRNPSMFSPTAGPEGSDKFFNDLGSRVLSKAKNRKLGVICNNFVLAELVSMKAKSLNLDVPGDVRIVAVSKPGDQFLPFGGTPISHVPLNWEGLGYKAAELMSQWVMYSKRPPMVSRIAPLEPVIQDSTLLTRNSVMQKVKNWIIKEKKYQLNVEEIAREIGVNPATLTRNFKKECSQTPKELLLQWRIEEAKRCLAETRMDIATIAARCGYKDHSTFSAAFKERVGLTPSDWRKKPGV